MSEKSGFTIDWKGFDRKFAALIREAIPQHASEGLSQAGALLIRDAILEPPRAPHKWGGLWDSQLIPQPIVTDDSITLQAGFNICYAHRLHEAPQNWNWTLPGSGPKYLEAKLAKNKDKYMKHVADYIRSKAR